MTNPHVIRYLDRSTPPHISTLILLTGLSALTLTVFLPSLPKMTAYFETDYRLMQLSVAVYLGVNAFLQVFIGPVSDKLGRRPVILWGIALFILATLGCLLAQNVYIFLFFRMTQAVVVVGMVLGRAVVRDMYPQDEAASMIGYVTMGTAVVPMFGPAIGGVLDQTFGWHAVFVMLLISGAVLYALVWADMGETGASSELSLGQQIREYPELLTSPRFWGYSASSALSSGAFFAYLGGAPFVGTVVFGMESAEMGIFFGAPAVGYFAGNFLSGRFSRRAGINKMITYGTVVCAFGVFLSLVLSLGGMENKWTFFGLMTFVGLGNGLVIPNATAGALSVRPHLAGTASGLSGAMMLGGGAGLSAWAGALLTPESGAWPLLALMFSTCVLGQIAIGLVVRRERRLQGMSVN